MQRKVTTLKLFFYCKSNSSVVSQLIYNQLVINIQVRKLEFCSEITFVSLNEKYKIKPSSASHVLVILLKNYSCNFQLKLNMCTPKNYASRSPPPSVTKHYHPASEPVPATRTRHHHHGQCQLLNRYPGRFCVIVCVRTSWRWWWWG